MKFVPVSKDSQARSATGLTPLYATGKRALIFINLLPSRHMIYSISKDKVKHVRQSAGLYTENRFLPEEILLFSYLELENSVETEYLPSGNIPS